MRIVSTTYDTPINALSRIPFQIEIAEKACKIKYSYSEEEKESNHRLKGIDGLFFIINICITVLIIKKEHFKQKLI